VIITVAQQGAALCGRRIFGLAEEAEGLSAVPLLLSTIRYQIQGARGGLSARDGGGDSTQTSPCARSTAPRLVRRTSQRGRQTGWPVW
jgi:hypothetical protein